MTLTMRYAHLPVQGTKIEPALDDYRQELILLMQRAPTGFPAMTERFKRWRRLVRLRRQMDEKLAASGPGGQLP